MPQVADLDPNRTKEDLIWTYCVGLKTLINILLRRSEGLKGLKGVP